MKRIVSVILLVCMCALMFCACEETPDVVAAKETEVTLENLDWKFAVEGGDKTEYTYADAQAHELKKVTTSAYMKGEGNILASFTTFIVEGCLLSDVLADLGRSDATSITYYGTNVLGDPEEYTIDADSINDDKTVIGWIMNKKTVLLDSSTYVGLFFTNASTDTSCISLEKIVIH